MKTFYFCIVCIVCIIFSASGQVTDDFSDGDFTQNPAWTGDTEQFEVNTSGQLHLHSAGSDTSVMFTREGIAWENEWSFWMKLSFNTSANNHARIYLVADTSQLKDITNGYFLQAGGANDSISIVRQTGNTLQTVYKVTGYLTVHSTNTMRFKITRDPAGNWEVMIDTTGGHNYIRDGAFSDGSTIQAGWFGLMCRYTSSNATKFYFDDFYSGPIRRDTIQPRILYQETNSPNVLRIAYSEPVQNPGAVNPDNYKLLSHGTKPDSVVRDPQQQNKVSVFLPSPLTSGINESLKITNIPDFSGNLLTDTTIEVCYYVPRAYDVLIHEIMADPDPPVELPDGEFVELFNRSEFPISLKNWIFLFGSYSKTFPEIMLPSREYIVVAKDSAYQAKGRCALLFSSSSSLSNEGTTLVLKDDHGHIIHTVTYQSDWYQGSFKEGGGWSLEMADPANPCGCQDNWKPSTDASGGTPGKVNSVFMSNPDETAPVPLRGYISDSAALEVNFSEPMDSVSLLSLTAWSLLGPEGSEHPVRVIPSPPGFSHTRLMFGKPFESGFIYTLNITGKIKDCAGNACDTLRAVKCAIPEPAMSQDIVINEILSNPASGGARFLELYNRSEKVIDLKKLVMAGSETGAGYPVDPVQLTAAGYLLFPGGYLVLTSSPEDICDRYPGAIRENILELVEFPTFGDDSGTVVLAKYDNLSIVDRLQYRSAMHYPLLTSSEGVSLERTCPDLSAGDDNNWHSAAETAGFGTPGYRNSHWIYPEKSDEEISVEPPIFSPDNDGRDDLLLVSIREKKPDYNANIMVYDSRGRLIRLLANNVFSGTEGVFIWDGMTESNKKASIGFYVILIELTWPDGSVKRIKKATILGGIIR